MRDTWWEKVREACGATHEWVGSAAGAIMGIPGVLFFIVCVVGGWQGAQESIAGWDDNFRFILFTWGFTAIMVVLGGIGGFIGGWLVAIASIVVSWLVAMFGSVVYGTVAFFAQPDQSPQTVSGTQMPRASYASSSSSNAQPSSSATRSGEPDLNELRRRARAGEVSFTGFD